MIDAALSTKYKATSNCGVAVQKVIHVEASAQTRNGREHRGEGSMKPAQMEIFASGPLPSFRKFSSIPCTTSIAKTCICASHLAPYRLNNLVRLFCFLVQLYHRCH